MEFKQYLRFARRWFWLILALAIPLSIGGYMVGLANDPMYQASTTLLVNRGRAELNGPNFDALVTSERRAITYSILLTKRAVLSEAIGNLGLSIDPGALGTRVTAEFLEDTELIILSVQDRNPQRAADLANEIPKVFNRQEAELLADPYAASIPSLHVVEAARPGSLMPAQAPRNAILGGVAGALLAIAIGMIVTYLDNRIRTSEDIERAIGMPALATITRLSGGKPAEKLAAIISGSSAAEAYRMFRAHIELAPEEIRSLVVTSASADEGKSTTAANLAVALAQTGKRVALIDANLRQPVLHELLRVPNTRGLTNLLSETNTGAIQSYLLPTSVNNLALLPGGPEAANPAGLLGTERITEILDALKQDYDLVVIDSPALLEFVEATLLVQASDASVVVVRAGHTRADALKQAHSYLLRARKLVLGTILNNTTTQLYSSQNPSNPGGGRRRKLGLEIPATQNRPSNAAIGLARASESNDTKQPAE